MCPQIYLPSIFLNSSQKGTGIRTIEVNLDRGLFMPEAERMYVTVSQASLPYSIVNISQDLFLNACFTYGGVEFIVPEGSYLSLTELEQGMNFVINGGGPPLDSPITLTGNTSTNQVIITNSGGAPPGDLILSCPGKGGLFKELGFDENAVIGPVPPNTPGSASNLPVLFNDIIASGILISCELDLQCTTFFNNLDNSNILAQVPISSLDVPGGMITYPRDVLPINCPIVANKSVKRFNIRFTSPRDPFTDLVFMQGDCSVILLFTAVY